MILVTGAGGAVGSALLEELRAAGHRRVRAAFHSRTRAQQAVQAGHDATAVDFGDPATLASAVEGIESLFLLGATGPEQAQHELAVVRAAESAGVRKVVKLSVWRAPEELTPIARLHRSVEEALEASSLDWTLLRPNFYMQNFSRQMSEPIRRQGIIAQPATGGAISFIDVRDVARVAARVLTSPGHDGRAYALTGPEALTYPQAAEVFSRVLRRPIRFIPLTDEQARRGMLDRGLPAFHADALLEVAAAYRGGGAEAILPTVAELTGRDPGTLEQFVTDHVTAFA